MWKKIVSALSFMRGKKGKKRFMTRLVEGNNEMSSLNFFVVITTLAAVGLLVVPIIAMIVDLIYNHTLLINLSDLGSYILAVAGVFTAAGLTNAWSEYSYNKFNSQNNTEEQVEEEPCEEEPQEDVEDTEIDEAAKN